MLSIDGVVGGKRNNRCLEAGRHFSIFCYCWTGSKRSTKYYPSIFLDFVITSDLAKMVSGLFYD